MFGVIRADDESSQYTVDTLMSSIPSRPRLTKSPAEKEKRQLLAPPSELGDFETGSVWENFPGKSPAEKHASSLQMATALSPPTSEAGSVARLIDVSLSKVARAERDRSRDEPRRGPDE